MFLGENVYGSKTWFWATIQTSLSIAYIAFQTLQFVFGQRHNEIKIQYCQ